MSRDDWIFEAWQEWSQITGGCNWYTITPIHLEFEWDKMLGGVECTVVLLGLGVRVRWNYTMTGRMREILCRKEEIERNIHAASDSGGKR